MPAVSSLAVTDAILCLVTLFVASRHAHPPLLRISAAMFSVAALLGALRFSGIWPAPPVHMFASMLAGVGAFPALATAVSCPTLPWVRSWGLALTAVLVAGAIGAALVMSSGWRLYLDLCAIVSVLALAVAGYRQNDRLRVVAALVMLTGLLLFAMKIAVWPGLEPADGLHLALAAGWLGVSYRRSSP